MRQSRSASSPAPEVAEVDDERDRDRAGHDRHHERRRPHVAGDVPADLEQREEAEEGDAGRDEDPVGGDEFHVEMGGEPARAGSPPSSGRYAPRTALAES